MLYRQFPREIGMFLGISFLIGCLYGIFMLDANLLLSALGYSNAQIGIINAIPVAGTVLGIAAGYAAPRFGYRAVLMMSVAMLLLGPFMILLIPELGGVLGYLILTSGGMAFFWVVSGPVVMRLSPEPIRTHVLSASGFVGFISMAVGSLIGGIVPEWFGAMHHISPNSAAALRTVFLVALALGGSAMALVPHLDPMMIRAVRKSRKRKNRKRRLRPTNWSLFGHLLIAPTLLGLGAGAFLPFQQLYLHQRFALDPGPIALILAGSQVVTGVGILAAPWLAEQVGRVNASVLTIGCSIPFLLLLAITHNLVLALLAVFLRGLLMNINNPIAETLALSVLPEHQQATYAGWESATGDTGRGGIGPALSGVLQSTGGFGLALLFTALCYTGAAAAYATVFRDQEPEKRILTLFRQIPGTQTLRQERGAA